MILSWVCNNSADLVTDNAGKVMGIYSKLPSFSVGMNSLPSFIAGNAESASVIKAMAMVSFFQCITQAMTGR